MSAGALRTTLLALLLAAPVAAAAWGPPVVPHVARGPVEVMLFAGGGCVGWAEVAFSAATGTASPASPDDADGVAHVDLASPCATLNGTFLMRACCAQGVSWDLLHPVTLADVGGLVPTARREYLFDAWQDDAWQAYGHLEEPRLLRR